MRNTIASSAVAAHEHMDGVDYLTFQPTGYDFPISLPVITKGSRKESNAWTWNGCVDKPTLRPSVRTNHGNNKISHIWLTDGICQHLSDSTDGLAGQNLNLVEIFHEQKKG